MAVQMKYAEGEVLQDDDRTLSSCLLWKMVIFNHERVNDVVYSTVCTAVSCRAVGEREGLEGRLPQAASSWVCYSINLYNLGLKEPSVNDLLTLILVWTSLLRVLFAVWAVSLSAVQLGVSIFMVEAGSKTSRVLRQTCWMSHESRRLEIYRIQRHVCLQLVICKQGKQSWGSRVCTQTVLQLSSQCVSWINQPAKTVLESCIWTAGLFFMAALAQN